MTGKNKEDYNKALDELWNYQDLAGTEKKFRNLLTKIDSTQNKDQYLTLLTQITRTMGLQGRFDQAHQLLDQVEAQMDAGGTVEVRYLLERGRIFNSSKQPKRALPLFKKAVEIGKANQDDFYVVDALHMLGISAQPEDRLDWNLAAIDYAEQSLDPRAQGWMGSLLNNTGWTYFDNEEYEQALALFEKTEAFYKQRGDQPDMENIATWSIGKVLRMLGRAEEALSLQKELAAKGGSDGFIEEEIAECFLALGDANSAKPYFQQALKILSSIDWVAEDTDRIERLKTYST